MKQRIIKERHSFSVEGTFESYGKACEWCKENGYSYGSMCRDEPIALMKGDYIIAKWRNLSEDERHNSDGLMLSSDFREASVRVIIYEALESKNLK